VNGEKRCSIDETPAECVVQCRKALIIQLCGCSPLTFEKPTVAVENEILCTFGGYEKCLNYSGSEDAECRINCFDNCEKWQYDISVSFNQLLYMSADFNGSLIDQWVNYCSWSALGINIVKFDFLIFEE
jgi:hypothetical protein